MRLHRTPRLSFGMLRGFEAAARRLSFTVAASDLCITQSAVSRQIQTLENQLDKPLFHRTNRGLELTEVGQLLFAAVEDATQLIDEAVSKLNERRTRAELAVMAAGPFASCWLVPRLARFLQAYPECSVRIETANEVTPLARNSSDLAIWHFPPGAAPTDAVRLADDEVLPVCSPALMRNLGRPLSRPGDLAGHVLIQFAPTINKRAVVDWVRWRKTMQLDDMVPIGVLSFSHYDQVLRAALDGSGVALGRLPLVSAQLREGTLNAPFGHARIMTGAWHVVTAAKGAVRPHVRAFLDWLRHEVDSEILLDRKHATWASAQCRRIARCAAPRPATSVTPGPGAASFSRVSRH
jgi:LysR family glycine cleavage system transcriptional activator